ncbi:Uu.00g003350.m01.CDS01 [Anthostomella pinea]|uniref:Uu.00g003350.m01.CDS01 n=1 Tax=Anthostomella pinea TaxID=933095 RepID=A0AAI8VKV9_9PEZI|nr:Uu.00g003350.m01.CDS01 [Anthostomella pinea]
MPAVTREDSCLAAEALEKAGLQVPLPTDTEFVARQGSYWSNTAKMTQALKTSNGALPAHTNSTWNCHTFSRTAPIVEFSQVQLEKSALEIAATNKTELLNPFSNLKLEQASSRTGWDYLPDKEEKEKTRGKPDNRAQDDNAPQRGMDTVAFLFYTEDAKDLAGQIDWMDVPRLFVKMGFSAEMVWGSTWKFRPGPGSPLFGKGHLNLDTPHGRPGSKLWFLYARLNGHFITARYGVDRANFQLVQ